MMDVSEQVSTPALPLRGYLLRDLVMITKARLNALVLTSTFAAFYLGSAEGLVLGRLLNTLLGTFLLAGGAAALNQSLERRADALMDRTRDRPLPSGRMELREAVLLGVGMGAVGFAWLGATVGMLTAVLGLTSFLLYVLVYTPLKVRSPLNTVVGAVVGALPPVMGWVAATGRLSAEAGLLFLVQFLWQHPHFLALAWKYRDEYQRAGYRMLPVWDPRGLLTGLTMVVGAALLIPVGILLTSLQVTGLVFLGGSMLAGAGFLFYSLQFLFDRTDAAARRVFFLSLAYLPLVLILMVADKA